MLTTKKEKAIVDHLIYVASILGPIMTLPQAYDIWTNRSAENVSLLTWATYALLALLWLMYGIFHKERPLVVLNLLLLLVNGVIVSGIVLYA